MKKFLCYLVVLVMLVSGCMPVMASEGKVEIGFCVGDATLTINGAPVTVEKPYVVGEGVTLVPIRVITEAFDAKVDWVSETQTVNLTYPDVIISIQIGNPVAEVNGRAETLLAAPELTESGYTMIPLRFISENFGAEVSYDKETKRITVTKEKSDNTEVSIEGSVDNKYIGDSYYGWSMENPLDMTLEYKSFDGSEITFSDGENEIGIEIFPYEAEDYDFEAEYNEFKLGMSEFTLVKAEKNTNDENCKSFHFGIKDKESYADFQQFVTPKYIYMVEGFFDNADASARDKYIALLATFECSFDKEDIYDMSNIKDGFRRFESEELKLSFDVPENYAMITSDDSHNSFGFIETENEISRINVEVFSKSDVGSASELAKVDYDHNKGLMNENLAKFSEGTVGREYASFSATEYTYTIESKKRSYAARDVFFEVGDYVYNISVSVELPNDDSDGYMDKIIESLKFEELDSEEVGTLLRNMPIATGTTKVKLDKMNMEVPNIYMKLASGADMTSYTNPVNGVTVACVRIAAVGATAGDLKNMMITTENQYKENGAITLKTMSEERINNQKFLNFRVKTTEDEPTIVEMYSCINNGYVYLFTIGCTELSYSENTKAEMKKIVESIKFDLK